MIQSFTILSRVLVVLSLLISCASQPKKSNLAAGNQYARDGLLREAVEAYKKEIAQKPNNMTAHRNLGMVLVKSGDYRNAARYLEKSMAKYDDDFDANYYLGEAYRAQDKYSEAIFRYKNALKVKENDPRAMKPLAWSYFKIRFYSEALSVATELQKVAPDDDQTGIILARTLLKLNRAKDALAVITSSKKKISPSSRAYYASVEGDAYYDMGDKTAAQNAYKEALKIQPLLAGALLGLGRCALDDGKTKLAINFMERAVRIRPRLTEAHYLLGKAYEPTDRQKSLKYYQHFRKQASADPEFVAKLTEVRQKIGALQQPGNAVKTAQ